MYTHKPCYVPQWLLITQWVANGKKLTNCQYYCYLVMYYGWESEEVGHDHVRYLFVLWFPYISIYARRELNVINSGTVVLVMTILKSYPGLPALGCFIQTWYHVMFIPVHDTCLSAIVLAGNNRIALLKAEFSVSSRMHACFVQKNA